MYDLPLLIGCPVYDRDWILPLWFDRIKRQEGFRAKDVGFLFVASSDDQPTLDALFRFQAENPGLAHFEVVYEDDVTHKSFREPPEPKEGEIEMMYFRRWSETDAQMRMAKLRNTLLARVREIAPMLFFSLDSDVLLEHRDTIRRLAMAANDCTNATTAWSPLMFMSDTQSHPNVMQWKVLPNGRYIGMRQRRIELHPAKVDIIMAAKMMSVPAYHVDYSFHRQGEDLGWALNCKQAGIDLWLNPNIYASHILSRKMLNLYQHFGDLRTPEHCKYGTIKSVKPL